MEEAPGPAAKTGFPNTDTLLNPKLVKIIFKNSVRTSIRTQHFTVTKINWSRK
jgi:hypothetical protein